MASDLRISPERHHQSGRAARKPSPVPLFFDRTTDDDVVIGLLDRFGSAAIDRRPRSWRAGSSWNLTVS